MSAKGKQPIRIDCVRREIVKVGPKLCDRKQRQKSENELIASKKQSKSRIVKVDAEYLKSLNLKYWKYQDHYQVLGLQNLRYLSTPADIRQAFKKVALEHHPDKRRSKEEVPDAANDYFSCIIKAYEILSDPKMKQAFDSVDPEFDDSLPNQKQIQKKFYSTFRKYFQLNSRWSKRSEVPPFGNKSSSRDEVKRFYKFWYNFKSWREFGYLDKQYNNLAGRYDREKRRLIDRENRINRYKRKKEEMLRIRTLVDLAYHNDERVKKFKDEERQVRLAAKKKRMTMMQILNPKVKCKHKVKVERTEPKRTIKLPLPIEQQNVALQRQQRILRDKIKEHNYFQKSSSKDLLRIKKGVERICKNMNLLALRKLNRSLAGENAGITFYKALTALEEKLAAERKPKDQEGDSSIVKTKTTNTTDVWDSKNMELFAKALALYPLNSPQRCKAIANYINRNVGSDRGVTAADVLYKLKILGRNVSKYTLNHCTMLKTSASITAKFDKDNPLRVTIGKRIVTSKSQSAKKVNPKSSDNSKTERSVPTATKDHENKSIPPQSSLKLWTKREQMLLERAINAFPTSAAKRWTIITKQLPNRTKSECELKINELLQNYNLRRMTINNNNHK